MKNIQETECVLQRAYDIDIGKINGLIDPNEVLSRIGVMSLHAFYYDGGLAQQNEIRQHLKDFPDGQFAHLVRALRDARIGEYTKATLNRMYGLDYVEPDVAQKP